MTQPTHNDCVGDCGENGMYCCGRGDARPALSERIAIWAHDTHGWQAQFVESDVADMPVAYKVGPVTGFGKTTNEAVNNAADGLITEGWSDDRTPDEDDRDYGPDDVVAHGLDSGDIARVYEPEADPLP